MGIDSIAGPSEILVLADETANPKYVAADRFNSVLHILRDQDIAVIIQGFPDDFLSLQAGSKYDDFMKKSNVISYSREALERVHKDIEAFAESEGLT